MVTNLIHWIRTALYLFAGFEFMLLAVLYQIAYRHNKKSEIIKATQRVSFILGIFFFYISFLPMIKATGCLSCYDKSVLVLTLIMIPVDIYAYRWVMLSTDPKQKKSENKIKIHPNKK